MDKQSFYIRENISGIWVNDSYLFELSYKGEINKNLVSFTNKDWFPRTGVPGIFFIVEQDYYCILRIEFHSNDFLPQCWDFKIDKLDAESRKMNLSHYGYNIDLTKVA